MGRPCAQHHHVEASQGPPEAFSPNDFLEGSVDTRVLRFGIWIQTLHSCLGEGKEIKKVEVNTDGKEDKHTHTTQGDSKSQLSIFIFTGFLSEENTDSLLPGVRSLPPTALPPPPTK